MLKQEGVSQQELDLVCLSSAESGVNERRPGDELVGLTYSFIYAGTPSVITSLWAINDLSTLMLMETFYGGLAQGLSKSEALQRAQLALMRLISDDIVKYIDARRSELEARGELEHARLFWSSAYKSLLATEQYKPIGQDLASWHPFAHPASWAPFILVGDWR